MGVASATSISVSLPIGERDQATRAGRDIADRDGPLEGGGPGSRWRRACPVHEHHLQAGVAPPGVLERRRVGDDGGAIDDD
jgi:hypothetical protein